MKDLRPPNRKKRSKHTPPSSSSSNITRPAKRRRANNNSDDTRGDAGQHQHTNEPTHESDHHQCMVLSSLININQQNDESSLKINPYETDDNDPNTILRTTTTTTPNRQSSTTYYEVCTGEECDEKCGCSAYEVTRTYNISNNMFQHQRKRTLNVIQPNRVPTDDTQPSVIELVKINSPIILPIPPTHSSNQSTHPQGSGIKVVRSGSRSS